MARFLYLSIGVLLLLQSCGLPEVHTRQNLDLAENLMPARPDSSLMILENIKAEQISSRKDRARYAILYTQAKDKNFIDETELSPISEAKKYYEGTDNVRYKFLASYYYGRILCNTGNLSGAIIAYTEAERLLRELDDDYLAGLLYVQVGNIYRIYHDYNKCLEAYKSAHSHYSMIKQKPHVSYALLDIGIAYWNLKDTMAAEEYITNALNSAIDQKDEYLERVCYENLIILYDEVDEIDKCGNTIIKLNDRFSESLFSPICLGAIASYNAKIKEFERARDFLSSAMKRVQSKSDSIALYFQSANIMKSMGNASKALSYLEEGIILQNDKLYLTMQQPILSAQKEYFENQAEYNSYRLKKNTQIYITLAVIALLIMIVVTLYIRQRIMYKDLEISKYMDLAKDLQSSIQERDNELSEMSERICVREEEVKEMHSQIVELFHKQYELLDKLSNTYYETHGFSQEKERIYERVKSEIQKFASDKKSIVRLEKIVNTYKYNVINLIRNEIPDISDRDIKLLCYVYAGFSAKSISIFIGETTGNILTRKCRLRSKITQSKTPNMDIMIQEMP